MKNGAIFDLDGTLVSSGHIWKEIDIKFLKKRGFEVPADYAESISCYSLKEAADYTIARFGLCEKAEDIVREWHDMADIEYSHLPLKRGAKELLIKLKESGIKTALATAADSSIYGAVLKANGIEELFDLCVSTEQAGRGKDFPDVYLYAADRFGLSAEQCVVFEDAPKAASAAFSAGFTVYGCIDVLSGKTNALEAVCKRTFYDFEELMADKMFLSEFFC